MGKIYLCAARAAKMGKGQRPDPGVCCVLDYPEEGDTLELPRGDEGAVRLWGFGFHIDRRCYRQAHPAPAHKPRQLSPQQQRSVNCGKCRRVGGYIRRFRSREGVPHECLHMGGT